MLDLFLHIKQAVGSDIEPRHADAKPGEQQRSVVDTKKIRQELGWEQNFDLKNGLAKTVDWFKTQVAQNQKE